MKLVPKRRVLIVDGNNIAWRWAFRPTEQLKTSTGIVTTVCYGIIESVLKANHHLSALAFERSGVPQRIRYDDVIICWDARGANWRHQIFSDYKSNRNDEKRKAMKAEVMPYIETAQNFLSAINMKQMKVAGLEGDDLIAVLSSLYANAGWTVTIVSGDHDLWQLLSWGKTIIHDGRETFRDEGSFCAEFGFSPLRWPEAKALMGDDGDSVPGVEGIAIVLAQRIVAACDSVLTMEVDKLPKIKRLTDVVKDRLRAFIKDGRLKLNYRLVQLTDKLSMIGQDHLNSFNSEYQKLAACGVVNPTMFMSTLQYYQMNRFIENYRDVIDSCGLRIV